MGSHISPPLIMIVTITKQILIILTDSLTYFLGPMVAFWQYFISVALQANLQKCS